MVGRAAYHNPYILAAVDQRIYGDGKTPKSREQVLLDFMPYVEEQLDQGARLNHMTRHLLGLFHGVPGGKLFRRHLSEHAHKAGAGVNILQQAYEKVVQERHRADERAASRAVIE